MYTRLKIVILDTRLHETDDFNAHDSSSISSETLNKCNF